MNKNLFLLKREFGSLLMIKKGMYIVHYKFSYEAKGDVEVMAD